jgi:glucose-1-phosphate thymidylyltransferase
MKGVILAGGTGSRLSPLTKITNKHLLPIYDRPMVYFSIQKLKEAGVEDILLISGKGHVGQFLELLGSGRELGVRLSYEVQNEAGGVAHALKLAKDFVADDEVIVVLADNVFEYDFSEAVNGFSGGAHVFLKDVPEPQHYGVARIEAGKIIEIIEKPVEPPSSLAVTGCYIYTSKVFEVISRLKPSARGELEISDVNQYYVDSGEMKHSVFNGFWGDCGESIDKLSLVSEYVRKNKDRF